MIPPPATSQPIGFRLSGHGLSNGAGSQSTSGGRSTNPLNHESRLRKVGLGGDGLEGGGAQPIRQQAPPTESPAKSLLVKASNRSWGMLMCDTTADTTKSAERELVAFGSSGWVGAVLPDTFLAWHAAGDTENAVGNRHDLTG